jgi:hypothetical protein
MNVRNQIVLAVILGAAVVGVVWMVLKAKVFPPRLRRLRELRRSGRVVEVLLIPAEVGGRRIPANIIWLPPEAARGKATFDKVVVDRVKAGETVSYSARPEYRGDDMVPVRLRLEADAAETTIEVTPP